MTPEISEFSYGFALTNELVGWVSLKAAPIFPSLIEEGKKGGGYDVKLDMPGIPLYLQFKRADCLLRSSARELKTHRLALSLPFYRFAVTQAKKSQQHQMLLELDDGTNEVYYAAPRFHEMSEINRAWDLSEVSTRSIFVTPQEIGVLDSEPHHVAYDRINTFVCSEPRRITCVSASQLEKRLSTRIVKEDRPLRDTLAELISSQEQARLRAERRMESPYAQYLPSYSDIKAIGYEPGQEVTAQRIEVRAPRWIEEDYRQLRTLADNASKSFNAQLVIVQKKDYF